MPEASLTLTEGIDSTAILTIVPRQGSLNTVEGSDTVSVQVEAISQGELHVTEGNDVVSIQAEAIDNATLSVTEGNDISHLHLYTETHAEFEVTEVRDTSDIQASVVSQGGLNVIEENDVFQGRVSPISSGALSVTESEDSSDIVITVQKKPQPVNPSVLEGAYVESKDHVLRKCSLIVNEVPDQTHCTTTIQDIIQVPITEEVTPSPVLIVVHSSDLQSTETIDSLSIHTVKMSIVDEDEEELAILAFLVA